MLNVVDFGFVCLGVFVFVGCWIWIAGLAVCLFVCLLTVESGNEDVLPYPLRGLVHLFSPWGCGVNHAS